MKKNSKEIHTAFYFEDLLRSSGVKSPRKVLNPDVEQQAKDAKGS